MQKRILLVVVLSLFTLFMSYGQTQIFWGNTSTDIIYSADLDGSNVQPTITGLGFPEDVNYNPDADVLYYVDGGGGALSNVTQINTDGSGSVTLIDNLASPDGVAVDLCAGKIYYAESTPANISRMDLDGSNVEVVISGAASGVEGIAIDPVNQKLYWVNTGGQTIMRADFDGTGIETVFTVPSAGPLKLAKDMSSGILYFTEFTGGSSVSSINGDGTGYTTLVPGLDSPGGIALDLPSGKMFFADRDGVYSANIDGSGLTTLVTQSGFKLTLTLTNDANLCGLAPAPTVPTMGEWGLISLGILLMIFGVVAVGQRRSAIA